MLQTFPQIRPNRLSGDDDEWRILIRWKQELPTAVYTIPEALSEAERLQQAHEFELEDTRSRWARSLLLTS
jgi:hypothetical protein